MADGDVGQGTATIRFIDAPKGKGPWWIKTDGLGGVPEQFKSWDAIEQHPGQKTDFTWQEKPREYDAREFIDFFIKNAVSVGDIVEGSQTVMSNGVSAQRIPAPMAAAPSAERDHRISYWAAIDRAISLSGPGPHGIDQVEKIALELLTRMDAFVDEKLKPATVEAEATPAPAPVTANADSDSDVPF